MVWTCCVRRVFGGFLVAVPFDLRAMQMTVTAKRDVVENLLWSGLRIFARVAFG